MKAQNVVMGVLGMVLLVILLAGLLHTTSDFAPDFQNVWDLPDFLDANDGWGYLVIIVIMVFVVVGGFMFLLHETWA